MRSQVAVVLVLLAVPLATVPGAMAAGSAGVLPGAGASGSAGVLPGAMAAGSAGVQGAAVADRPDVVMRIDVQQNGDARWTVTTYVPLDSESDVRAFEQLGRDFENGTADVEFSASLFRRYARLASDATGRRMRVPEGSVEQSWRIEDDVGVLVLSFTWTNFAREDGDELIVDDAFDTKRGTWLPRLEPGQVLVIGPPEGYSIVDSPPGPGVENSTLRWEGPRKFDADYFHIVYRRSTNGRTTTSPPTTTTSSTTEPPDRSNPLVGIIAAVLLGGGLAVYLATRRRDAGRGGPAADESAGGDGPAGATEEQPGPGSAAADEAAEPKPAPPPKPTPEEPFAGIDVEMLSDEERILRLLEANGGRMKQARIVKETGWSNAKVSQLLSSMAEDDQVDKLRIGRENLISLPDVDIGDVES